MTALLEVRNIAAAYGDVQALWDVTFSVEEGKVATLLGSNGAGKTTSLRVVSGLLPALEGEVLLRGTRISGLSPHRIVELGVIQVPEGRHLWPNMSVEDNLLLGAYSSRSRPDRAVTLANIYTLFPRLAERRGQLAGTLSGGEQQMAAIGRGLMGKPEVLMLDEPSLGLAPIVVEQMFEVIRSLHAGGMTILLVEQNLQAALEIATRGYVIETGQVKLTGTAEELRSDPKIRAAYLGL